MAKKNKIKKLSKARKETSLSERIKNQVPVSNDDECPSEAFGRSIRAISFWF